MRDIRLELYIKSLTIPEHRSLRLAADAAEAYGSTTYLADASGKRIAKIVPLDAADTAASAASGQTARTKEK